MDGYAVIRPVDGDALQPSSTATTVRVRDGKTLTTDGPYAETKEQLGGYYLVEAKDLDEAIKIGARIPSEQALIIFAGGREEILTSVQLLSDKPGAAVLDLLGGEKLFDRHVFLGSWAPPPLAAVRRAKTRVARRPLARFT